MIFQLAPKTKYCTKSKYRAQLKLMGMKFELMPLSEVRGFIFSKVEQLSANIDYFPPNAMLVCEFYDKPISVDIFYMAHFIC